MSLSNALPRSSALFLNALILKILGPTFCRLPVLLQSAHSGSGLTCLHMVAHYHGKTALLKSTRCQNLSRAEAASTSLVNLIGLAHQVQLSCRPRRMDLPALFNVTRPMILLMKHKHYVVLKHSVGDKLYVHDPAHGMIVLNRQQAALAYSGVALELAPMTQKVERSRTGRYGDLIPSDANNVSNPSGDFSFRSLLARHPIGRRQFYFVLLLMLLTEVITLSGPYLLQVLIDQILIDGDFAALPFIVIVALCLGILYAGSMFICSAKLNELEIRRQLQRRLKKIRSFLRCSDTATVAARADELMLRQHTMGTCELTANVSTMTGMLRAGFGLTALVMLMLYDLRIALLALSGSALLGLLCHIAGPTRKKLRSLYNNYIDHQQLDVLATLRRYRSVRIFQRLSRWKNRHHQQELSLASSGLELLQHEAHERTYKKLVLALQTTLVLWMGCVSVEAGSLTPGMFIATILYFAHYMHSAYWLSNGHIARLTEIVPQQEKQRLQEMRSPSEVMNAHQRTPSTIQQRGDKSTSPMIALRQIRLRYADHAPWVLDDVSFSLDEGEALIIAGRSGSGKSSLFKLLLGEKAAQEGTVHLKGMPVSTWAGQNAPIRWAAVLHGDQLTAGSVRDNIAWLEDVPRQSAIEYCARQMQIHEEILRLPKGYATQLDALGAPLSAGQIQRLLLARALYHEPEILLLDEATCLLDAAMENKIHAAIASLRITRIIISQRLAASGFAARVVHISPTDKPENLDASTPKQGTPVA